MHQRLGRFLLPRIILNETNGFNLKWILKANFLELDCVRMENLVNCHVNAQNTLFQPRDVNVFSFTICLCGQKKSKIECHQTKVTNVFFFHGNFKWLIAFLFIQERLKINKIILFFFWLLFFCIGFSVYWVISKQTLPSITPRYVI